MSIALNSILGSVLVVIVFVDYLSHIDSLMYKHKTAKRRSTD
jgi:hypothetical protein